MDLCCGAGGLSWGLARARERLDADVEPAAVDHWQRAIETRIRRGLGAGCYDRNDAEARMPLGAM